MARKFKGIKATPCGNKTIFNFSYNGKRHRITKAIKPSSQGLHRAEQKWFVLNEAIDNGRGDEAIIELFPNSKLAKKIQENNGDYITVEYLLDRYLQVDSVYEIDPTTRSKYKPIILNILIPAFGEIPVTQLKRSDIEDWKARYHTPDKPIVDKTLQNILAPLYTVMKQALQNGVIEKDIFKEWRPRIKALKKDKEDINPFTRIEVQKILNACEGQFKNLIQFAFGSGLRTSELMALRWSDIDFKNKLIKVRAKVVNGIEGPPKTASSIRDVDMLDDAMQALKNQKDFTFETNVRVFHHPKNNIPWKTDKQIRVSYWMPALEAAEVEYRKPYQTRHTYASHLLTVGVDPSYIAKSMGHSDWFSIRKHYATWIKDSNNGVQDKINAHKALNGQEYL